MHIAFNVDNNNVIDFAEILIDNDMRNEIIGITDDGLLTIDVIYNRSNQEALEDLEELSEEDE